MSLKEPTGNSTKALALLRRTGETVTKLLSEMSSRDAGYNAIAEILTQISKDIEDASERAEKEVIRIGILGGRGSGKSTLANALLGERLLPESAIVFCTSIPTTIKYARQYHLAVESAIPSNQFDEITDSPALIRTKLQGICKESENPENVKQVTKIELGVPRVLLDGKEIVDVPGFTKGNALHQAFAERYAKYYCDICLVLVNNSESVEIGGVGGIAALCNTFRTRLESTVFIINRADQSSPEDLAYVAEHLRRGVSSSQAVVFKVSSTNALTRTGEQFEFTDLLAYLSFLSGRKLTILVRALLQRLSANFSALRDLCQLSGTELEAAEKELRQIVTKDFRALEHRLRTSTRKEETLPESLPSLDVSQFTFPHYLGALGPNEYANQILDSFGTSGAAYLAEHAQELQAQFFRLFTARFDEQVQSFDSEMRTRLRRFETDFRVRLTVSTPSIENHFSLATFNPAKIERLRPTSFRSWTEQALPGLLSREIVLWKSPITLRIPLGVSITFSLPIPLRVKSKKEAFQDIATDLPAKAVDVMNGYLFDAISRFTREMEKEYAKTINRYLSDWQRCMRELEGKVKQAKTLTEPGSVAKLDSIKVTLDELLDEAGKLAVPA